MKLCSTCTTPSKCIKSGTCLKASGSGAKPPKRTMSKGGQTAKPKAKSKVSRRATSKAPKRGK